MRTKFFLIVMFAALAFAGCRNPAGPDNSGNKTPPPVTAAALALEPPTADVTPANVPGMVTLPPEANFAVTAARWLVFNEETGLPGGEVSGAFEQGEIYVVVITLNPNAGFAFAEGFSATINGDQAVRPDDIVHGYA
ncbi:MAG: hypothetical protein FWD91_04360 [Treponema sp.]|nr:hypothetical protein [Treponema sp.]